MGFIFACWAISMLDSGAVPNRLALLTSAMALARRPAIPREGGRWPFHALDRRTRRTPARRREGPPKAASVRGEDVCTSAGRKQARLLERTDAHRSGSRRRRRDSCSTAPHSTSGGDVIFCPRPLFDGVSTTSGDPAQRFDALRLDHRIEHERRAGLPLTPGAVTAVCLRTGRRRRRAMTHAATWAGAFQPGLNDVASEPCLQVHAKRRIASAIGRPTRHVCNQRIPGELRGRVAQNSNGTASGTTTKFMNR